MIENSNGVATVDEQVEQQVEQQVEGGVRGEITGILDGLKSLRKVKSLTGAGRDAAEAPLLEGLRAAIAELGQPVARGNTLYAVVDGALIVVDLTPKTLIRL